MLRLCRAHSRLYFSKQKIPFNFTLPPQELAYTPRPQTENSADSVRPIKLKRKGIDRFGLKKVAPVYQSEYDFESETEKKYREQVQQKYASNIATENFYKEELKRGEDLIDEIPIDPYYQYKMEDLRQAIHERKEEYERYSNIPKIVDNSRAEKVAKILEGYNESKHRYQLEEFEKYLSSYPGSLRGPNPEDDKKAYTTYALKKIPKWLLHELELEVGSISARRDDGQNFIPDGSPISDFISSDRAFNYLKDEDDTEQMVTESIKKDMGSHQNIVPYSEIPLYPQVYFEEYHSHFYKTALWSKFRSFYEFRLIQKKNAQLTDYFNQLHFSHVERTGGDTYEFKPVIYSLFTYYKTLPKQVQEDPAVRTCYLGLEYCQPDLTYDQKQDALNEVAALSRPLDRFSDAAMTDLVEKKKYYLTPHLVDRIFNIHPEFTWDIHEFLKQVKEEKLRTISTVKQKEENFPEPPQKHLETESNLASLPVDFYDNDDGFWDEYIDKKYSAYQEVRPLSFKPKTHFIH